MLLVAMLGYQGFSLILAAGAGMQFLGL